MKPLFKVMLCVLVPLIITISKGYAEDKSFKMGRSFCQVEVRAGNSLNALDNPVIHPISNVNEGDTFTTDKTFIFAQREGNPGVCNSGRANWNSCNWNVCTLN